MINQVEELLRAGVWLGPALLGAVAYRVLSQEMLARSGDDLAGAVMLATGALILTIAGTRFNKDQHAALGPAVFAAMFIASWFIR